MSTPPAVSGPPGAPGHVDAEAFLPVAPARLALLLLDPFHLRRWAPRLVLHPYEDRGAEGMRGLVSGELVGRVEWWLEPVTAPAGVQVHFWLSATATRDGDRRPRRPGGVQRRQQRLRLEASRRRWRAALLALEEQLVGGRQAPGGGTRIEAAPEPPGEDRRRPRWRSRPVPAP